MKLTVVIPVYNEVETIDQVISRVKSVAIEHEIIVVDDGSTDGTRAVLERYEADPGVRILLQPENRGKGAALQRGFEEARGDIVLVQDADLEYDPRDYPTLLGPILDGQADVVYGSRFSSSQRKVHSYWHTMGNRMLTLLSNWLSDMTLTDMETCYKVFRREVIQNLLLTSNRFGIEPEMTAKVARIPGIRIFEVPISYNYRTYAEGKKIGWKDGVSAVARILYFNLRHDAAKAYRVPPEEIARRLRRPEGL